jgi:hypothetical protein
LGSNDGVWLGKEHTTVASQFHKGAQVTWDWGEHHAKGEVVEIFTHRVSRILKGAKVVRLASIDEPAYLIRQSDGDRVLKSASELKRA